MHCPVFAQNSRDRRGGAARWAVAALALVPTLSACGDLTDAESDNGLFRFRLVTDYEVPEDDLRDATIVAGHEQELDIDLTNAGEDEVEDASDITYRITPSDGVETDLFGGSSSNPPDLDINVPETGTYRIDAMLGGEVVDGIDLMFETSDAIELSVRVRQPWGEDFNKANGASSTVTEGAQATFLPIPLGTGGKRLAGDIEVDVTATPEELVVPGASVGGVYEQGVWTVSGEIDFYFIDPGDVDIRLLDTVSGAEGTHSFTVEDYVP